MMVVVVVEFVAGMLWGRSRTTTTTTAKMAARLMIE